MSYLVLFYLSRKMIFSIDLLKVSTQRIASGDLSSRVEIDSNDEFQILAYNFNKMTDSVELKNKQLEEYTLHLEDEVKIRTDELIEKEHILAQQSKMASMGEMLENIAHQWRQPLSVISTASTGLKVQKEMGLSDEEAELKVLDTINNTAQYLSSTIDVFRNFLKSKKQKSLFDLKTTYDSTFSILSSKFKNLNINIIDDVESISVFGFDGEMTQVIMNLLNNSSDVLQSKDIEKMYIFVNIYKDNDNAILEVIDNGGGVSENIIDKVFDPYFTTKHQAQGTGIGLYMCQKIINQHMDGLIEVKNVDYIYEDKNYKGACFKIILPTNK